MKVSLSSGLLCIYCILHVLLFLLSSMILYFVHATFGQKTKEDKISVTVKLNFNTLILIV